MYPSGFFGFVVNFVTYLIVSGPSVYDLIASDTADGTGVTKRGIHLPDIHVPSLPDIHIPSPEEILRRIREALEQAKTQLDRVIRDESSQAEEVLRNIRHFLSVQIELLPERVRDAVQEFEKFRHEHPYLVAAATVALVIFGSEVILPWMFLNLLRLFGFGLLGPVAGMLLFL